MNSEDEAYLSADLDVCQGYVNCVMEADSYFAVGDDGKVRLVRVTVDPADLNNVEAAVSSCPVSALTLTKRTGQELHNGSTKIETAVSSVRRGIGSRA
jgi:ferredoxin